MKGTHQALVTMLCNSAGVDEAAICARLGINPKKFGEGEFTKMCEAIASEMDAKTTTPPKAQPQRVQARELALEELKEFYTSAIENMMVDKFAAIIFEATGRRSLLNFERWSESELIKAVEALRAKTADGSLNKTV